MRDSTGVRAGRTSQQVIGTSRWAFCAVMMTVVTCSVLPRACFADAADDYNLSLQLYKQERWDRAAEQLTAFLKANPDHEKAPNAQLYLGQALVHLRKFEDARPVFRDFVRKQTDHPDLSLAMYRIAECSYFLDDFPTARKEFLAFLDKTPRDHALTEWALQYLGDTELRLGNAKDASAAYAEMLQLFPDSRLADDARFGLARAYERLDRSAEAIELYRQLAANPQGPRAADAQFNLSARLFEGQQYADAAESFDTVANNFPQSPLVALSQLNAGFSRYHLGDHSAAIESFTKVAKNEKYGPTARYWIGLSQKALGQFDQAADGLLALYREDEQQPLAANLVFHAADCKLSVKAYEESQQLFLQVVDKWPDTDLADDSLHSAIEAALLAGNIDDADQIRRRFVEQFPASGLQLPVELLHGRLLLARGDQLEKADDAAMQAQAPEVYQQSADIFQKVLDSSTIPQTQVLARLQLARAFDRLDAFDKLVELLQPLVDGASGPDATDDHFRALIMQSNGWLALKQDEQVLKTAEQYLTARPEGEDAAEAVANMAIAQTRLGNWDAGQASLQRLSSLNDRALADRITYEIAEVAYDAGRWPQAESLFKTVIEHGPDGEFYVPSVSGLAYSLHNEGRGVLEEYNRLKNNNEQLDATARLSDAVTRFDESARWFSRLIELAGGKGDLLVESNAAYMQGLSLRLARQLERAVDVFVPAVERFQLPADVAEPSQAQLDTAMNAFRSAREAARSFKELAKPAEADQAYQAAYEQLKRQPQDRQQELDVLINEWALLHYEAEAYGRAAELFRRLIEERPDSQWADDARYLLAENDYFSDRWEQARQALEELLKNEQTDDFIREKSLTLLVDSAANLDDWQTVRSTAQSLREAFPEGENQWYAAYRLGESSLRLGEYGGAAMALKALVEQRTNPEIADAEWLTSARLMLCESQLRLKDYAAVDETIAEFKQEHAESPFMYQFDDVLGRRYKNEARFDEARQAFQRVIESSHGKGTETAAKSQFFIGETWLTEADAIKDDPDRAEKAYEAAFLAYYTVLNYDFPEWQAPALFQAGLCDEALQKWNGAKKSYQLLIKDHPDTKFATDARQRLDDLNRRFPDT